MWIVFFREGFGKKSQNSLIGAYSVLDNHELLLTFVFYQPLKMKKTLLFSLLASATIGASAQTLGTIESVEYDNVYGRFLVSNVNSIVEVDGNGDEVAYFGTSATASYGMEVMGNTLFAISGTSIKGYDLTSGSQVTSVTIAGASFLNGLASDGGNRLWVTDFGAKKIYEISVADFSAPVYELIYTDTKTPNGITYDGANNRLVYVCWGGSAPVKSINLADYTVSILTPTSLTNCDGIDHDGDGNFYVASWSPTRITKFSNEFGTTQVITAPGLGSPADICYAEEIDTLAIPNSSLGTVTFVGFTPTAVQEEAMRNGEISVFPNPVNEASVIDFSLPVAGMTSVKIYDAQGRMVRELMNENVAQGQHRILLAGVELAEGMYWCEVQSAQFKKSISFKK